MNVTLTGATGRFGTAATRALLDAGFTVRATDRRQVPDFPLPVEVADLLNPQSCYPLLEGADAVVHLGNLPGPTGSITPQQLFNENTVTNFNVFEAARDVGVKKIIFSSSIQVITGTAAFQNGEHCLPYLPLDGDVPANPGNPYALSKQVAETILASFARHHGIDCVAIRFPLLTSPRWLRERRDKHNNANEAFAVLHMPDAASLIVACLNASLLGYRVYLPASTGNSRDRPLADLLKYYSGVPLRRPLEKIKSLIDISRIHADTGWWPQFNSFAELPTT